MIAGAVPPRHMETLNSIGLGRGAVDRSTSRPYLITISPITLFGDGYPAPKPNVTPLRDEADVMGRQAHQGGSTDRDLIFGMSHRYPPMAGLGNLSARCLPSFSPVLKHQRFAPTALTGHPIGVGT